MIVLKVQRTLQEHVGERFVKIVLMIALIILRPDVKHMSADVYVVPLVRIGDQNYAQIVIYVVDKHVGMFKALQSNYMNVN
jgi:hypothetical protein